MKKIFFFWIVLMVMAMQVHAQGVGINTDGTTPDNSALLDVKSPASGNQLGMLIPRTNLTTATFPSPGPAAYLQLVNTNAAYASPANSRFNTGIGMYMNFGTPASPVWRRFLTSADSTLFWGLRGNSIPDTTNYIGTSNAQNLSIRTNGVERIQVQTPVSGNPTEVVILNATNLRVPIGTASTPSLRFTNTTLGMFGLNLSTPSVTGIGMGVGTQAYIYFTNTGTSYTNGTYGIRIRRNAASNGAEALPESSVLDVEGNIFTRGKLVYQEYALAISPATVAEKTFKNERFWADSMPANTNGSIIFRDPDNGNVEFRIRRGNPPGGQYVLQINSSAIRTFVCNNATATVNPAGTFVDIGPLITGPNGSELLIIKDQLRTNEIVYRVHIFSANNMVSVIIERWSN